jgi:hypothetical protein
VLIAAAAAERATSGGAWMNRPTLKQYSDINEADLNLHPVWLNVHGIDEHEPWYGETNEITYRPWDRVLPYDRLRSSAPRVLVAAKYVFADGSTASGFLTPPVGPNPKGDSPSYTQPEIFVGSGRTVPLYAPVRRLAVAASERLRDAFGRDSSRLFPIHCTVPDSVVTPAYHTELKGIYYLQGGQEQVL